MDSFAREVNMNSAPRVYVGAFGPPSNPEHFIENVDAKAGYYTLWEDDEWNCLGRAEGRQTQNRGYLQGILVAVGQAISSGMGELVITTDCVYVVRTFKHDIIRWKTNGYTLFEGGPVRNQDLIKAIEKKLQSANIKVYFELIDENSSHDDRRTIEKANHLAENGSKLPLIGDRDSVEWANATVVHTAGHWQATELQHPEGFCQTGYGVFWEDGSVDNQCDVVKGSRTLPRTDLWAVAIALKQAEQKGLKRVIVRTLSPQITYTFFHHIHEWTTNGWLNTNGTPVLNRDIIEEILEITDRIPVRFEHPSLGDLDRGDRWSSFLAASALRLCDRPIRLNDILHLQRPN